MLPDFSQSKGGIIYLKNELILPYRSKLSIDEAYRTAAFTPGKAYSG
jgi:hypothetical protein